VTITVTRSNDDPVNCEPMLGTEATQCPEAAPPNYEWIGSVTLSAPDSTSAWSTIIRRTGLDGGINVWTGNLNDGGTHDFGPIAFASGTAPGANFQFQVRCEELLGDGVCEHAVTVSIPNCDGCGVIPCETTPGSGIQKTCGEGYTLSLLDCECYEDGSCPGGEIYDAALGMCRANCEVLGMLYNSGSGLCECPEGEQWNGTLCEECLPDGELLLIGSCVSGERINTYADGNCGSYQSTVPC
jgi:hypothetical protein